MTKRPDVSIRNKINNPIWKKEALEKMRASLTGKKQSEETKQKRAKKLKKFYADPEVRKKMSERIKQTKYHSSIAGTGWAKISKRKREEANHKCQDCGAKDKKLSNGRSYLVVHYLDWNGKQDGISSKKWNNKEENLIVLCGKCHSEIHRHKARDYHERKRIMQGLDKPDSSIVESDI